MNITASVPSTKDLRSLGQELAAALSQLIENEDGSPPRPTDLRNQWKLEQTFCVRVCGALRAEDPFATLYQLPALTNLRGLVSAARRRKIHRSKINRAESAVLLLKNLVDRLGGNKSHLDTLLSAHVPAARAKLVHASKQSIHHGMSRILGAETEVALTSFFVYPNQDDPKESDVLALYGSCGLRRMRPDLTTILGGRRSPVAQGLDLLALAEESLSGTDFTTGGLATPLTEFCTKPLPKIEVKVDRDQILYLLPGWREADDDDSDETQQLLAATPPPSGAVDLFFASIDRCVPYSGRDIPRFQFIFVPRGPIKTLVFDVRVHRDLWTEHSKPVLEVGRADNVLTTIPSDDLTPDQLHCESVETKGSQAGVSKTQTLPRLSSMIDHVHQTMGWDADEFVLNRTEVRYPVVGFKYKLDIDRGLDG